ncbi:MAG: hypothetical protein IJJ01_11420 [Firmicutes bacterium]|nr:hypothetical protein [Bacillota bacterium]
MPAFFRGLKAGSDGDDADDDAFAYGEMTVMIVTIVIRRDHKSQTERRLLWLSN